MKKSLKHLMNILMEKEDYISSKDLASIMNCSHRYINKTIEDVDYGLYNDSFLIKYKPQKGYKLEIRDQKNFVK